jgi:hypothetical protein
MNTELLVCLSFNTTFSVDRGYIESGGKQYCWLWDYDYISLKESYPSVIVGYDGVSESYDTNLQMEIINDQDVINVMLKVGPGPFSTFRSYIGPDSDDANRHEFYVECKTRIKYRSYPTGHVFPEIEREEFMRQ